MQKTTLFFIINFVFLFAVQPLYAFKPTNPVNASWIRKNLKKTSPKLILNDKLEKQIKNNLATDPLTNAYVNYLRQNADNICKKPLLKREVTGRRLLDISREAVYRIGTLAMVYRLTKDEKYLNKLEQEVNAVCQFTDWNPSHFLDVSEMAFAVSIGIDWAGDFLSPTTLQIAKNALREKAIQPSLDDKFNFWVSYTNNWNQVCHGGITAAALAIAHEDAELAAKVISRSIDNIPLALAKGYAPDGAYPEGPSYWGYGTTYSVLTLSMFESAFGTDFGLSKSSGFLESAKYVLLMNAPSGECFNYADSDCPNGLSLEIRSILSWFAQKTGNSLYLEKEKLLSQTGQAIKNNQKSPAFSPQSLIWLTQFKERKAEPLPLYWSGSGSNPVAVFRAEPNEQTGFYLAAKGGSASVSHGNMDAGSFIFELGGVRWSIDPGNQNYHELEQTIGADVLWNSSQNSHRWSLLTKGNIFHSTLTVNDERHVVNGYAPIDKFNVNGSSATVSINLTEVFRGRLEKAVRQFTKVDERTLRIEDEIGLAANTKMITWAMMTKAQVSISPQGAILMQQGKRLKLTIVSPEKLSISIISLNPPPLPYDKVIEGLKRIEIRIPSYILERSGAKIVVELQLENE